MAHWREKREPCGIEAMCVVARYPGCLTLKAGRPDLDGREREVAARPYETLNDQLLVLPPGLEIYRGGQAGSACGVELSGKPARTMAFKKRFYSMLSESREEIVSQLIPDVAPLPIDMAAIVAANLRISTEAEAAA